MGNDFFSEIGQVNPWNAPDPGAGPQDERERDFFAALEALKAQRNAALTQTPQPEEPAAPPMELSPPDAPAAPQRTPEDVGHIEAGLKAIPGTAIQMGSSAAKGVGIGISGHLDPYMEKMARLSPTLRNFMYFTGLGDDTIDARQTNRLAYTLGEAETPDSNPADTSLLYQLGDWAEKGGYSMFGIDAAVQQKATYKAVNAAAQAIGMGAEWLAASAVLGPVAGTALVSAHGGMMELGSSYDQALMMGATPEEALGHAERRALAATVLEAVSFAPIASALGRTARGAQAATGSASKALGNVGKASFDDPVAKALEAALKRRGISVRQKGVARGITAVSSGLAEGGEEYLTGVYGDIDLKYLGQRWAPKKSWVEILAGPERFEEFFYGAIGGGTVGSIVGGRLQFTPERKAAAKQQVIEAAQRRGVDPGITDESIEGMFRRAEDRVSPFVGKDMATIGKAIEGLRGEAVEADSLEAEIELTMVADGLSELYEAAGVRAGIKKGMTPEKARDLVRGLNINELGPSAAALEEVAAAQDIRRKLEKFGLPAIESLVEGYRKVAPTLTGVKRRVAEAYNRVLQKIGKAQQLYDETTMAEEQEKAADQERAQMLHAATADQLQRGAEARLNNLRRKWPNPEARRRAVQLLLADTSMDLNEADPTQQVPGVLYTAAMLDMPLGIGPNPDMTVRDAFLMELQNMSAAQEMEYQEQLAEMQDKQAKLELQAQQNEMKRQQQAFKDMFAQMKMQEQLRQWNAKVEQQRLQQMTEQERLVETRRKMEQKRFDDEQKQQEKARQAALAEPAVRMPISAREKQALIDALEGESFKPDDVRIEGNELLVSDPEFLDMLAERLEEYNEEQAQEEALDKQADKMRDEAKKGRKKQAAKKRREKKRNEAAKPRTTTQERQAKQDAEDTSPRRAVVVSADSKEVTMVIGRGLPETKGDATSAREMVSAKEVLQAILKTDMIKNTAPLKMLGDLMVKVFDNIGWPTLAIRSDSLRSRGSLYYEVTEDGNTKEVGGEYYQGRHHIDIAADFRSARGKEWDGLNAIELTINYKTLLHEMMHALTSRAISARGKDVNTLQAEKAIRALNHILDAIKKDKKAAQHYGTTNIHELVAEAFTNKEFQKYLRGLPVDPSLKFVLKMELKVTPNNMWDTFVNALRVLFKFKPLGEYNNMLDSVLTAGAVLADEQIGNTKKTNEYWSEHRGFQDDHYNESFQERLFSIPPMSSQHKGAWAPAMINGEKVEVQQGPLVLNKKTNQYDRRWVTIRKRDKNGKFVKGVEKKIVPVTTLGKWLAQSNGTPTSPLHAAFGLPAPAQPAGPSQPTPPPPPPLNFNTKDPDQKKAGWKAWASHLMRWGSQIELAFGRIGTLLNRWGHDAGQMASQFKGTFTYNVSKAEEWARKAFPSGDSGRISGAKKMYFGMLLSGMSIADELTKVGTDKWGKINESFLRAARAALGFDPATLYTKMNESQAQAAIGEAQTKAKQATHEEERKYWERRADYIATALHYHAEAAQKGELSIMHSLESLPDPSLKHLLPPLMSARASHDMAYKWRENLGLNNADLVPHTQNHVYEGLSPDFFKEIKKNGEVFEAELESAVRELWSKANSDPKLFESLGLNPNASIEDLKKQVVAEARAALAQNTSSVFAQHSPKFGSFIKQRRGLYGVVAADWSMDGSLNYMDKAARDISYNRMARDFWLTKKDDQGNPVHPDDPKWALAPEEWFYHTKKVEWKKVKDMYGDEHYEVTNHTIDDTFSQILINAGQANAFKSNSWYGPAMIGNYILHTRGRELKDGAARAASAFAKFQYVTKLGNLFTVATNMSVLFTLGAVLGPMNMLRTMYNAATNWNDYKARAIKSGAVDPKSDPMSEFFSGAAKGQDNRFIRGLKAFEGGLIYAFSTSESVIRTLSAHAAEAFFNANVQVLQDPSKAGILTKLGISSVTEAKSNLKDILGLSDAEINALEKGTLTPAQVEQVTLKAMYRGSNEINFRHGGQYVPQMFSRNNALSIFTRVFKSFAYNVFAFQAKLFGKPLKEGIVAKDPALVKTAMLRAAKVYGGATLTAAVLNEMANMFKDDDDEDDLKGKSQLARFAYNRLNDLNTVGMFGLLSDPLSLADPISFLGGVNWRTAQNVIDYGQEGIIMPAEDIFKGRFGEGFDQFMHANFKVLQKELTHVRMLTDAHAKYFKDRKDYANARQVSRALYLNQMTTLEKIRYKKQRFQPSFYAKERDAVVNALAEGRYGDAMTARKELVQRIMQREEDVSLQDAITRARASVMMKAPLSEWSRTTNPEASSEQLMKFLTVVKDVKDRRDKAEAKRFAAAHLHYVRAVNALFPSLGK